MIVSEYNKEPVNIKFAALLKRNTYPVCCSCLISGRHVLTTGLCIDELLKTDKRKKSLLFAFIGGNDHKIIHTVYHNEYYPIYRYRYPQQNLGMALVCSLRSCIRALPCWPVFFVLCISTWIKISNCNFG